MSLITKNMISAAFFDLTNQKPVDKITVKDIVEKCTITRQTFYYHFQDIMDVIEWSMQQRMEEILNKSLKASSMQEAVRILVSTVEEHPEIINKLMNSQKREQTERLLIITIRSYMQEMIDRKELFMDMKRSDIKMAMNFYSYAIVGILQEINHNRKDVDLDLISKQIYQLMTGEMFQKKDI
ncbi:TetR/AcrR family transcriptional regulator C-terminal domain-containing protein [Sedimentibacter sp. MB31-C6]|uniref:TetR/AcrR family transcriptional regulator C-terminal domain-containing protein n=1 Tax=Sedimentibacter sp. MB31-C6 TaxID=3109366 RepID=UPI002DDDAE07|nr:TetR/AcrR family transcriptional regulator C-terminal domain-containing protein [Sedimentibacter sp. MB36-C1]WSI03177.1 TetR/AcrR family transcriptional regulator C-terminal domain-containing protein [Sedimentibacter sp. MB36-C1]